MKRNIIAAIVVTAATLSSAMVRQPEYPTTKTYSENSVYAAPIAGIGIMSDASANLGGNSINVGINPGYVFGGELGMKLDQFRAGLAVTYQYNTADDFDYYVGSTQYHVTGLSVSQLHTILNVSYDIENDTMFTPHVGAGAGATFAYVETGIDTDDSVYFAAQFGGGITADLSDTLALDLSYKYILSDDFDISIPGAGTSSTDLSTQQILITARLSF
jgi:opacity protein-like surface antigen